MLLQNRHFDRAGMGKGRGRVCRSIHGGIDGGSMMFATSSTKE